MRRSEPGCPAFRGELPDGGRVAFPCVYLCGSEHIDGVEYEPWGEGALG